MPVADEDAWGEMEGKCSEAWEARWGSTMTLSAKFAEFEREIEEGAHSR